MSWQIIINGHLKKVLPFPGLGMDEAALEFTAYFDAGSVCMNGILDWL